MPRKPPQADGIAPTPARKPRSTVAKKASPAKKAPTVSRKAAVSRTPAASRPPAATKAPTVSKPPAAIKAPALKKPKAAKSALESVVLDALSDMKALDVKVLDVRGLTDIADYMIIASGTSDRHVRSVAQRVTEKAKQAGFRPHGVEGQQDGDWVLIDLNDMIVHVMLPRVREFYGLEKLWDLSITKRVARA